MSTIDKLKIVLKKGEVKESMNSLNMHAFPIYIQAFSNINLENPALENEDLDNEDLENENLENASLENEDLESENSQPNEEDVSYLYPANIFVYQKNGTGLDPNQGDRFMKVATAIDIDSLPSYTVAIEKSKPITSIEGYPFFRYNEVKLFLDNPEELEDLWQFVQEDVNSLCLEYNTLQNLTTSTDSYFPREEKQREIL